MAKKIDIDEEELMRLRQSGMSQRELGDHFGCSYQTVGRKLRKRGIYSGLVGERNPRWKGGERLGVTRGGYAEIMRPDHPRSNTEGYVKRSILMWEGYHGFPFSADRVPHHMDGDRLNDDPKNILSLLPSEHSLLHVSLRREARKRKGGRA